MPIDRFVRDVEAARWQAVQRLGRFSPGEGRSDRFVLAQIRLDAESGARFHQRREIHAVVRCNIRAPRSHGAALRQWQSFRARSGARIAFTLGMPQARELTTLSHLTLRARDRRRLAELRHDGGPEGYDAFGLHPAGVAAGLARMLPMYRAWFRVTSRKIRNLPAKGPAIVVANHGGLLPFDGLMLWTDIVLRSDPLRVPRTVMDNFVLRIPLVGTFFARSGAVGGNRRNVHHLLEDGELVVVFPEGTDGIGKPLVAAIQAAVLERRTRGDGHPPSRADRPRRDPRPGRPVPVRVPAADPRVRRALGAARDPAVSPPRSLPHRVRRADRAAPALGARRSRSPRRGGGGGRGGPRCPPGPPRSGTKERS